MNQDWLRQLAPGHAPSPPGWWPPAPGWWVIALLCLLLAAALVWWVRNPWRMLRQMALRQLRVIRASDADGAAVARAIENLLRRYALAVFGSDRVAKLTGESWLQFVIAHGGYALAGAPGRSLLRTAFGNHVDDDRAHWLAAAESFIRRAPRMRREGKAGALGSSNMRPGWGLGRARARGNR
jgi:hypothetical protein